MELIAQINGAVNGFVWGAPMLVLLIGVGILMTVRNRGLQFRKFGYAMKNTIGKIFHKTHAGEGEITLGGCLRGVNQFPQNPRGGGGDYPLPGRFHGPGRHGGHGKHRRHHHCGDLGRPGYAVLAVGHGPHWHGHQVF